MATVDMNLLNSCACSLGQGRPKTQGLLCFIRILVLFPGYKGTRGVNDMRLPRKNDEDIIPVTAGSRDPGQVTPAV